MYVCGQSTSVLSNICKFTHHTHVHNNCNIWVAPNIIQYNSSYIHAPIRWCICIIWPSYICIHVMLTTEMLHTKTIHNVHSSSHMPHHHKFPSPCTSQPVPWPSQSPLWCHSTDLGIIYSTHTFTILLYCPNTISSCCSVSNNGKLPIWRTPIIRQQRIEQ